MAGCAEREQTNVKSKHTVADRPCNCSLSSEGRQHNGKIEGTSPAVNVALQDGLNFCGNGQGAPNLLAGAAERTKKAEGQAKPEIWCRRTAGHTSTKQHTSACGDPEHSGAVRHVATHPMDATAEFRRTGAGWPHNTYALDTATKSLCGP